MEEEGEGSRGRKGGWEVRVKEEEKGGREEREGGGTEGGK
jgi:hypothetical protein